MDFGLNDDQAMLKTLIERFVADRYATGARSKYRSTSAGYSAENWDFLAQLGVLSLPFSEEDGGLGGGVVEIATTMEAIGRGLVTEPVLDGPIIGGGLIAQAGTAAQKQYWIGRITSGEAHIALAWAEHGKRFDLGKPAAKLTGNTLHGAKTLVTGTADAYVVTASDGDETRLVLMSAKAPGVRRREYRLVDGSVACELVIDDVLVEPMPGGVEALNVVADRARIAATAEMVGIMGLLFDNTLDYVRQRHQFGVAIGSFQALQHRLADQYAALEQARSQLYRAMLATENEAPAAIAAAKSYVSTTAIRLGEECIQMHGGMGVSDELDIGHGHKRILRLASLFGDSAHELMRYDRARKGAVCAALIG
ncbi:MAG: hypothetical protein JWO15_1005 [Sphingomonadales bacterium]|nr:hypothetical protein [Sphingomonadales bacterium]